MLLPPLPVSLIFALATQVAAPNMNGVIAKMAAFAFVASIAGAMSKHLNGKPRKSSRSSLRAFNKAVALAAPVASSPSRARQQDGVAGLSWHGFELLIGEIYRRQGYAVQVCPADGSDGGVDIKLRRGGQTVLVQCKHWKVHRVGVAAVRELFGVLTAEKADQPVLVTSGRFTPDAVAFAAGKPIQLMDGEALRAVIEASKDSVEGDLLQPERWSSAFSASAVIVDPVCPNCRSKMVVRKARRDGKAFWGCSTYPACRGIRNLRPELMGAAAGA